jgi:hypothetical protein
MENGKIAIHVSSIKMRNYEKKKKKKKKKKQRAHY